MRRWGSWKRCDDECVALKPTLNFCDSLCSTGGKDDGGNESVKSESLSEDHHKNDGNHNISLGVSTDTGVTDNSNAESSGEGGETTAKSSGELLVGFTIVGIGPLGWEGHEIVFVWDQFDLNGEEDGNNKSVNSKNTRHDDWDDGLEDELWLEDSDGADTDSRFGGSVGGSHVGEHETGDHTHGGEEDGLVWITEGGDGVKRSLV